MNRRSIALIPLCLILGATALYLYERTPAAAMPLRSTTLPWSANERAIPKLQEKLKGEPANAEWNSALGHAYLQKARETGDPAYYPKSEELFRRALASKPDYVEALVGQASLAMSRHEFARAREMAERSLKLNPDVVAAYGVLTDAQVELGEYDAAIKTLGTMVRMKPNLSSYSRISYLRELTGDVDGAIQAMHMAVDSGSPDGENTAWCMVQLGNLYMISHRPTDADLQFRMALTRFPNYVHALAGLARVAVSRKDFDNAVVFYEKAIAAVPLPEFLIGLGEAYVALGKLPEARKQFDLVRDIQSIYKANGVNMDLEMVLFAVDHGGNQKEAVETARQEWSRRKSIKVADAYAWALYRSGRVSEAREMMKQALRLGTRDPLLLQHARLIG